MLTGYNTDIKHEGVVYHVQTEDGGTENPVIVSLVYQGGRILVSKKTSYAQLVGTEGFLSHLRDLLERQHKTMIKAILTGNLVGDGARKMAAQPAAPAVPAAPSAAGPPQPGTPAPTPSSTQEPPPAKKPPLEVPARPAGQAASDTPGEKNLDQVILEYLASEIDND